jgi:hypothetical protein
MLLKTARRKRNHNLQLALSLETEVSIEKPANFSYIHQKTAAFQIGTPLFFGL